MGITNNMKHRRPDKVSSRYENEQWIITCYSNSISDDVFTYATSDHNDYSYESLFKPAFREISNFLDRVDREVSMNNMMGCIEICSENPHENI